MELISIIGLYGYIVLTDITGLKVNYKKPLRIIFTGALFAISIMLSLGFTFPSPSSYIKEFIFTLLPFLKGTMI